MTTLVVLLELADRLELLLRARLVNYSFTSKSLKKFTHHEKSSDKSRPFNS